MESVSLLIVCYIQKVMIQLKKIYQFIFYLIFLCGFSVISFANDFSISQYVTEKKQSQSKKKLQNIRIGWVTIDLTSDNPNLTNDQRITVTNSRETYQLVNRDFFNLLQFYYDFTDPNRAYSDNSIKEMMGFLTRLFYLNAANINNSNLRSTRMANSRFYHSVNISNNPRQAQVSFDTFYTQSEQRQDGDLANVNIGFVLLLATIVEPLVFVDSSGVTRNPLDLISNHLNQLQEDFFYKSFLNFFHRQAQFNVDPFAFASEENIIRFIQTTGRQRDLIIAMFTRSLSLGLSQYLINRNPQNLERVSTSANISNNFSSVDLIQAFFRGYIRALFQVQHQITLPSFQELTVRACQQISEQNAQQVGAEFCANVALTYQVLTNFNSYNIVNHLLGLELTQPTPPQVVSVDLVVSEGQQENSELESARRKNKQLVKHMEILQQRGASRSTNATDSASSSGADAIEKSVCCICLEGEISVAFIPCGHMYTCRECAENVDNCPMCRAHIISIQRIYSPDQ